MGLLESIKGILVGRSVVAGANRTQLEKLIKKIEEGFTLQGNAEDFKCARLQFDPELEHKESKTNPSTNEIRIGMKEFPDIEKISDADFNCVCNTVVHEYAHTWNNAHMLDDVKRRVLNQGRTKAHYAWHMLDEYKAYLISNRYYREQAEDLNSQANQAIDSILHYGKNLILTDADRKCGGSDEEIFYKAFIKNSTALVTWYVVDPERLCGVDNGKYKKGIDLFFETLQIYSERMPLTYEQYDQLGDQLLKSLMFFFDKEEGKERFVHNTHISI